jgi:signal transduction histidine kinase
MLATFASIRRRKAARDYVLGSAMPSAIDEIERQQAHIKDVTGYAERASPSDDSRNTLEALLDILIAELRLDFACARLNSASGTSSDVIRLPERADLNEAQQDVRRAFSRCLDADGHKWPFVIPNPLGAGHISIAVAPLGAFEKVGLVIAGSSRANFPTRTERRTLQLAADDVADRLHAIITPMPVPSAVQETETFLPEQSTIDGDSKAAQTQVSDSPSAPDICAAAVLDENTSMSSATAEPADVYEANAALERIVRGTTHPNEVMSRIHTFVARRETRKIAIDLTHVFAEMLSIMKSAADGQGVSLRLDCAVGLPAVLGNPVQLQQVMINLVTNALEATLNVNARRRLLAIHAKKHGTDAVLVRIRDSGKGLDPRQRQRVFEPFYTTKPDGLGMGLTVSRTIVEAHGGRLWASANDEFGETFQFTLPIAEGSATQVTELGMTGSAKAAYGI